MPRPEILDLSTGTAGLFRSGDSDYEIDSAGPPRRIDGWIVGTPTMSRAAPHGGEMHPDGDELLGVLTGAVRVVLELPDGEETVELGSGQAVLVPKGVWHRVLIREPSQLFHITPGPGGEHRPLEPAT